MWARRRLLKLVDETGARHKVGQAVSPSRRRVLSLSLALCPTSLFAQERPAPKVYRIAWLGTAHNEPIWQAFVEGLRERGWIEGKNVTFERLYSEGRNDRFPALAAQLVQSKVDLIVTVGTPPSLAAKDATTTIPIVFFAVGDAVGSGLVASLARPGSNVTGTSRFGTELPEKQLQLLKEMVPKASRIAMFVNDRFPMHAVIQAKVESAARSLGVTLVPIQVRAPEDFDVAFATLARERIDALLIVGEPMIGAQRERIAQLAIEHRMPAISPFDFATEAGVLMSYSSRLIDEVRSVPPYIDRILKGAKPADLPVERTTQFYLAINMKTATKIGLTVPPSLLSRADPVFW
jgi:putative ABC transport system substrate-binding protein